MRRVAIVAAFVAALPAVACGGNETDPPEVLTTATTAGPATEAASPEPTGTEITAGEVEGHWSGDWGDLYLSTENGVTRGVYPHDTGTVQGTLTGGVFIGWWCEVPTRQPPTDAGPVEFRFSRDAGGEVVMDGRWKYASEPNDAAWHEDWDLSLVATPIDAATEARLDNDEEFCDPP
jgi:hypothetical protein